MREGTTEYSVQVMFTPSLQAKYPLGTDDLLNSPEFSMPISFFYGDNDWMLQVEEDAPHKCIM